MKKTLTGLTLTAAVGFSAFAATPAMATTMPFANCSEAAAAGFFNILPDSPRYAPALDRDGDGVACEDPTQPTPTPPDPITDPPAPPTRDQVEHTPKGGPDTGVTPDKGPDATGAFLAAGGVIAVAGITVALRRKSKDA